MSLHTLIEQQIATAVELRHQLHRIPELAYEEVRTAELIRRELDRLGIGYVAGVEGAPTATIAWIGDVSRPCVALRADIDALPIIEATGLAYASTHAGRMHACGHDGHISVLLGAAAVLKQVISDWPVCVKLIFQPAEEGGGGADILCNAGALDGRIGPVVAAIFGLHGWPTLPLGLVSTKPGAVLAATDSFAADFIGRGCHAAFPHLGKDPIIAACEAVINLQQFVTRELDPTEPAVITIGKISAGTATNVIPDRARIEGTARTLAPGPRAAIEQSIRRRCKAIAMASGCDVELQWIPGYPPTINDPRMADHVAAVAREVLGPQRYIPAARPSMGGEDFSYYLQQVPGCFFFLGVQPDPTRPYPSLHSDHYDFSDGAIVSGMRMFVELVRQFDPATLNADHT